MYDISLYFDILFYRGQPVCISVGVIASPLEVLATNQASVDIDPVHFWFYVLKLVLVL